MEATFLTLSKGKLRTADLDYSSPVPALSVQIQPPLQLIHSEPTTTTTNKKIHQILALMPYLLQ